MRGSVPNYFNNSVEFLKKLGPQLVDAAKKSKLPENFVKAAKASVENAVDFGDDVVKNLRRYVGISKYGNTTYGGYTRPGESFSIPRPDKTVRDAIKDPARFAADLFGSNVFSEKNRQKVWLYSNPFRLVSKAGVAASKFTGLEDPVAAGAVAAGVPILFHTLTETSGPLHQGLRPKGYKAVAPVSKEEDPTGAKPRDLTEEAALRFFGGQKSQPLAYKDFIKERPDVMPSTISDYRRYMNRKPEAGKRIDIDPEKQTFTAFGGMIRGTARGLNDPEIRIKGAPISASAVLGTAAGVGTIAAGKRFLDPKGLGVASEKNVYASPIDFDITDSRNPKNYDTGEILGRREYVVGKTPRVSTKTGRFYQSEPSYKGEGYTIPTEKFQDRLKKQRQEKRTADRNVERAEEQASNVDRAIGQFMQSGEYVDIPKTKRPSKNLVDDWREASASAQQNINETVRATKEYGKPLLDKDGNPIPGTAKLNIAGQKFQEFFAERPGLKEPALVAGGLVAAVGTAAIAKKLFKKAEQERIKKEDPLQYKKYKRGDYTEER